MAIQFLPILKILKDLAPLVAEAGAAALESARMRKSSANLKTEQRLVTLEEEMARVGEVTAGLARQVQAIAEELRVQATVNAAQERKAKLCLAISIAAFLLGAAALIVAFRR